jgi:hypothetical protein
MNEESFKREMRKAQELQKVSDNPEYWAGFQRGLGRGFHGANGTEEEHKLWISTTDAKTSEQRKSGYKDGLAMAGFEVKVGRPASQPTVSFSIRLPQPTLDAIPEPKRKWVQDLVEKTVNPNSCSNTCSCIVPAIPVGFTSMPKPILCTKCNKPLMFKIEYCTQNNSDCTTCSLWKRLSQ